MIRLINEKTNTSPGVFDTKALADDYLKSQGITDTSYYNLYGSMYQGSIYKIDFGKGGHIITSCALVELYDFLKLDYSKSCCPCGLMPNPFYISDVKGYEIKRV